MPDAPELSTTAQVISSLTALVTIIGGALVVYLKSWAARIDEVKSQPLHEGHDLQIVGGALADRASMKLLANAILQEKTAREEMTVVLKEMLEVFRERIDIELKKLEEQKIEQEVDRRLRDQRSAGQIRDTQRPPGL